MAYPESVHSPRTADADFLARTSVEGDNDNRPGANEPAGIRRDWNGNVSVVMRDGSERLYRNTEARDGFAEDGIVPVDTYGMPSEGGPVFPAPRRGDWLQTFSGRQFWPMDPRSSEVFIEDIAHALAMQCRFAGHCLRFYSVAEHSVLLTRYFSRVGASTTIQLWALLHDASEAYLVDVPRPVKPYLEGYRQAEASVMAAICEKFGLPPRMPAEVHEADSAIIGNERDNMAPCVAEWYATGPGLDGVYLRNWSPEVAELEFTGEFRRLMDLRHDEAQDELSAVEARHDREASRADWEYQFRKEQEAA